MKEIDFPIFKTKKEDGKKFDLSDPKERAEYFDYKAGEEIEILKKYLKDNSFIVYLLGKKSAGKGTYSKMLAEVIDKDRIDHLSIGDMVRALDKELQDKEKKEEFVTFLKENYRGWTSVEELMNILEGRSTEKLLPTEFLLALVKREISRRERKVIFIDGFPRDMDQISYSLFFRDLIGYRDDDDFMVLIDVPEMVIDERVKYRRICPVCNTSRNLKLFPTSKVVHEDGEFNLVCDNEECNGARMVRKEGDEKGIGPIKSRLDMDEKLIKQAFSLYGIPKILLRNSIPVDKAEEYVDSYELTPEYVYKKEGDSVTIEEKPWVIEDDNGVESYSLLAPPVVVSFIKQLSDIIRG